MSIRELIKQPTNIGLGLFAMAAAVLVATIITGSTGLLEAAKVLFLLAQPILASAIAVLMYLVMCERQAADSEPS